MPFKKGQSGNPGGRPKVIADVREAARSHSVTAIKALVEILENNNAPPAARVTAANSILDRGYGRAVPVNATVSSQYVVALPEASSSVEEWLAKHAPPHAKKS
jgi:Family of unknown function (DUF5681)